MANRSKAKGYRGEVEVLDLLQAVVNEEYAKRGLRGPELSRSPHGRDIVGLPWLAPEVKRVEQNNPANVASWWNQCKDQGQGKREVVLFHRQNNRPWNVRMFGFLDLPRLADKTPRVRCPVDITVEAFVAWLRLRIQQDLNTPVVL